MFNKANKYYEILGIVSLNEKLRNSCIDLLVNTVKENQKMNALQILINKQNKLKRIPSKVLFFKYIKRQMIITQ